MWRRIQFGYEWIWNIKTHEKQIHCWKMVLYEATLIFQSTFLLHTLWKKWFLWAFEWNCCLDNIKIWLHFTWKISQVSVEKSFLRSLLVNEALKIHHVLPALFSSQLVAPEISLSHIHFTKIHHGKALHTQSSSNYLSAVSHDVLVWFYWFFTSCRTPAKHSVDVTREWNFI